MILGNPYVGGMVNRTYGAGASPLPSNPKAPEHRAHRPSRALSRSPDRAAARRGASPGDGLAVLFDDRAEDACGARDYLGASIAATLSGAVIAAGWVPRAVSSSWFSLSS